MINYGSPPAVIGKWFLPPNEFMCCMYMPIKMRGSRRFNIPEPLRQFVTLVTAAWNDPVCAKSLPDPYCYITVKTLWVTRQNPGNRPGWHADGYGSGGDLNYIWYDTNPTEFAVQSDLVIPDDDLQSIQAMTDQVRSESIVTFPCCTLLRLDESVVHRVGPVVTTGMRTFIKISFSNHQFNLAGNAHNYLFDYNWIMNPRKEHRNLDVA